MEKDRDAVLESWIDIQYDRNDMDFHRGTFRVRGCGGNLSSGMRRTLHTVLNFSEMRLNGLLRIDTLTVKFCMR